jgi:antitoxin ParD1/3/4
LRKIERCGGIYAYAQYQPDPEMDRYVATLIEKGQFANASEVLRAGLRELERSEREDQVKLEALRAAVQAGEESGVAEGDVMAEVRERIRRRALVMGVV